jgi:integrase
MEAEIIQKLKDKGLSDKSIKLYVTILKGLNDKKEIRDFKFLSNPKKILLKLKDYKPTTQRNALIAVVSVLKNLNNDLYKSYYDLMIEMNKKIEDNSKENKKTETQNNNWMKWSEVQKKFDELVKKLKGSKNISEEGYDNYLDAVILGLYTLLPPRRNVDYLLMKVSKDGKDLDTKFNWLDMKKKQFIFNNYKTKKAFGQQILDVPAELMDLLKKYLKYKKEGEGYLLVKFSGERLKSDNAITRRLNKIFDKNVSSSMLRHIYLSDKYGKVQEEMKDDAEAMAHSVSQQKDYIKRD